MSEGISNKEAASILGVAPSTLASWRCRNNVPQPDYFVVNGRVTYDKAEVLRFRETCRVSRRGQ